MAILFILAAFVPVGLLTGIIIGLAFLIQWFAEESFLFTTVKEGTAKAIMRGNSFHHFVMSFEDYHLNDPNGPGYDPSESDWQVLYHGKNNLGGFGEKAVKGTPAAKGLPNSDFDRRSWFLKKLGVYWIGWPWAAKVYIYQFEWNETSTDGGGKEKVLPRAHASDFIFVSDFTYAFVTDGAETRDRLPTDELTLATVAIRNPYRALFSGEDWMRRVTGAINRHVRYFVGSKTYQDLITPPEVGGETAAGASSPPTRWTEFSQPIIALSEELPDDMPGRLPRGLKGRYGVEIRTADLQTIELSGDGKEQNQKAATRAYVALQEAGAIRTEGQANADVILMKGKAEAKSLEARLSTIDKHGDNGKLLAQLDGMGTADRTVIWANNPWLAAAGAIIQPTTPPPTEGGKP